MPPDEAQRAIAPAATARVHRPTFQQRAEVVGHLQGARVAQRRLRPRGEVDDRLHVAAQFALQRGGRCRARLGDRVAAARGG
ncbi:MAG: hypothetical protein LW860_01225, partial [Xanthomonadaceae bacterium]|nr:hypothetical protein [Xanthomonadaceae bacterium]